MVKVPKTVRRTLISIAIMMVLFVLGGIGYVYYTDRNSSKPAASSQALASYTPPSLPKPVQPSPNAVENASVDALDSPVSIGQNTSITIQTNPKSTCTISVTYNNVISKDSGLEPKKSDDYGIITWSWTIDNSVPVGTWPIKVFCTYFNGKTAMVESSIQVTAHP